MARPREFNELKVKEALMSVFWDKGYEATSMQDLVGATGLLKGSLYGAFGDKQALYMTALAHYDHTRIQAGIEMLAGTEPTADKIANLFNGVIQAAKSGMFSGGCLLCNASVEMAPVDKKVANSVKRTIKRLQKAIESALEAEQEPGTETAALAGFIITAYLGSRVLAKAGAPLQTIIDARDGCLKCIGLQRK
jgi:TetR/AcrR family transcriptional repressor of nem operon